MKQKIIFHSSVIALFVIAVLFDRYYSLEFLKFLPGLLMLYYLPGNNINDLLLRGVSKQISWSTKFALDITSSIAVVYLGYSFFKSSLSYTENLSYVFIIALNLLILGLNFLGSVLGRQKSSFQAFSPNKENMRILLFALIPIALFLVRIIFHPYIYEIDALPYFNIYTHILERGFDDSWLAGQRNGFAIFMVYSKYIADIGFIGFAKFFIPTIFYLVSIVLLDFVHDFKNKHLALLSYLLLLASPMLIIMTEDVRPETFLFLFTLPVFYLFYSAIKQKSAVFAIMAITYSYVSFRFHDLGTFLLLASLVTIATSIWQRRKEIVTYINSNRKISLIILLSCLALLAQNVGKLRSIFATEIFQGAWNMVVNMLTHPQWRWWFLTSFTDIDDGVIAWPGWTAVLYYLYGGVSVIVIFVIACILFFKSGKSNGNIKRVNLLPLLPIAMTLAIYLAIAEILPRIGLNLFPNRTWPHLMLALVFIIMVLLANIKTARFAGSRFLLVALWLAIFSGVIGTMIGTIFMGGAVSPKEKGAIAKVRSLPAGSIIVSTQLNGNIATLYGGKSFLKIDAVKFDDHAALLEQINAAVNNAPAQRKKALLWAVDVRKSQYLTISHGVNVTSVILDSTVTADDDDKLAAIREYNPKMYQVLERELNVVNQIQKQPLYFLYSFDRLNGVLARRDWWVRDNDPENMEILKNYSGDDIVYKDSHDILIRIK